MQGSRWVGRLRRKGPRWVDEASSGFHSFPPEGLHHQPHLGASGWRWGKGAARQPRRARGVKGTQSQVALLCVRRPLELSMHTCQRLSDFCLSGNTGPKEPLSHLAGRAMG